MPIRFEQNPPSEGRMPAEKPPNLTEKLPEHSTHFSLSLGMLFPHPPLAAAAAAAATR